MPFRFNRRRTRFTAAAMLIVWLLVVGMGMANACLANEAHARHGHPHHHHDALADDVTAEEQLDQHAQPTSPAKETCQNFCAAAQSSVFKQQSHEPAQTDIGPVVTIAWWPVSLAPYRHSPWAGQRNSTGPEPSVAIRFLRLTL
jgi:hypothetical protein